MKRILILIIGFLPLNVFSQNYLNGTNEWFTLQGDFFDRVYFQSKFHIEEDTLIEGNTYKKIRQNYSYLQFDILGNDTLFYLPNETRLNFLREENMKFYRWRNESESLIIDFDLELGDTVQGAFTTEEIIEIDSVMIGSEYRKIFYTDWNSEIYEGIGTNKGLFEGLSFLGEEGIGILLCYSENEETYDFYDGWLPDELEDPACDQVFLTNTKVRVVDKNLIISPNPVEDWMKISCEENGNLSIKILDATGRILKEIEEKEVKDLDINLLELPSGVYMVVCRLEMEHFCKKIVKK